MTTPAPPSPVCRQRIPVIVIALVALIGALTLRDYITFETLRDNREALLTFRDANYAATAVVFVVTYIAMVSFSMPGAILVTMTGGFLFGLIPGALFNVIASTTGAVIIFSAVRAGFGRQTAARIDASGGKIALLTRAIRENEIPVLLSLRMMPVMPFFLMNVLPALIGVRLRVFAATTFFGIIPGGFVYTWVGAGLGEVFARDETPDLGVIFEPNILGPIVGIALLSLMPVVVKAMRGGKGPVE